MSKNRFKKKLLNEFYSFLSFKPYEWQSESVWKFFRDNLDTGIFIAPRQNGKSQILVLITMIELLLNGKKILFSSHEVSSCDDFFKKITFEFESNPMFNTEVSRIIRQRGAQEIVLANGACIKFRARTKSAGIGGSNEILIFDEFQFITDSMMSAMLPTIAAMENPKVIYAGTCPRLIDDDVFFKRIVSEYKGKPNLFEWGIGDSYSLKELEEQNLFLDKDLLKRTNPSFNISIDYKTVVQEYKTLDNLDFAVQRLGLLHSIENKAIFNQNSIERVLINRDQAQKYKGEFILGIKFSTDYHCAVIASKNQDKVYLQVLDKRKNKDGFDWLAKFILENSNIKGVVADGMFRETFGEMIKKKFKKRYKKINSHEFLAGQQLLEYQINTNAIDVASQQGITEEFLNVTWKQKGDYKKFTSLNVEQDISVIEAMALASNYVAERFK